MATLPIPAKIFFSDFAFGLIEYTVTRNSSATGVFKGLKNKDEDGRYIGFLMDAELQQGDVLHGLNETFIVKEIGYDYYNGVPEMIKAYY